jgi:hypothetical protein
MFIYNYLEKYFGKAELIYLGSYKPDNSRGLIVGPWVYYKFLTSSRTVSARFDLGVKRKNNKVACLCESNYHICGLDLYKKLRNVNEIMNLKDYDKFMMNSAGEIFTTITGFIFMKYYYLKDDLETFPKSDKFFKHVERKATTRSQKFPIKFIYLFMIMKKNALPRPVFYMILFELSKLHLRDENCEKYTCSKCEAVLNSEKLCKSCDICNFCYEPHNRLYVCKLCDTNYCRSHFNVKLEVCGDCF